MKKVLILCTGNSCRSIMAEALINHYLGDKYKACSAGVEPSVINPWAVRVLTELGIDTGEYYSKRPLHIGGYNLQIRVVFSSENLFYECRK